MKSMFSLFQEYEDCRTAVDALIKAAFDKEEMNVIVKEENAKAHMDVNLERVNIKATDELGKKVAGLDVLLGAEQSVVVPRLGKVYAAGKLATILAKTAAAPDTGSLEDTLEEFGIPRSTSLTGTYVEAMMDGAVLFWIRTSDERAAEAGEILRDHHGVHVIGYAG